MSVILEDAIQELFIALTTRWHQEDGVLAIGVPQSKLLKAGGIQAPALENLLKELREKVSSLGLDVIEYLYKGERWYAIRSNYVAPSELTEEEEAVLAYIMSHLENCGERKQQVQLSTIKKKMLAGDYLTETQFDRVLRQLEHLGYIERHKQFIQYSCRTLLEFNESARKHIAEEAKQRII